MPEHGRSDAIPQRFSRWTPLSYHARHSTWCFVVQLDVALDRITFGGSRESRVLACGAGPVGVVDWCVLGPHLRPRHLEWPCHGSRDWIRPRRARWYRRQPQGTAEQPLAGARSLDYRQSAPSSARVRPAQLLVGLYGPESLRRSAVS